MAPRTAKEVMTATSTMAKKLTLFIRKMPTSSSAAASMGTVLRPMSFSAGAPPACRKAGRLHMGQASDFSMSQGLIHTSWKLCPHGRSLEHGKEGR
jgi:hypothetical protein